MAAAALGSPDAGQGASQLLRRWLHLPPVAATIILACLISFFDHLDW